MKYISKNEKPEIFNTDQGSQVTSEAFTGRLKLEGIRISMDGRGRWCDNVFVERVWKSIKYEEVYLHTYETVREARNSIGKYLEFYNSVRPHSSLDGFTPDQVYFNRLPEPLAAKTEKQNFHLRIGENCPNNREHPNTVSYHVSL